MAVEFSTAIIFFCKTRCLQAYTINVNKRNDPTNQQNLKCKEK